MNTFAHKTTKKKRRLAATSTEEKSDTHTLPNKMVKNGEDPNTSKWQALSDNSQQVAQLTAYKDLYHGNRSKPVQLMFPAARTGLRHAGKIATGLSLAGGAAEIYGKSKGMGLSTIKNPEHWDNLNAIGREVLVQGLALSPFGKTASAVSFANNLYDMHLNEKEGKREDAIQNAAQSQLDFLGVHGVDLKIFGHIVTALGGAQKLYNNKSAVVEGFATVSEFMNSPISDKEGLDPLTA